MHLAAADVHVVGERVGQLHRDRSDLAADASEVVEQARPLARKLGKQRCEPEHVHRGESIRRSEASGAPSSALGALALASPLASLPCPGGVATRRRGTASASRSFSTSRSTASSRLRDWLRSSCATARSTGPARATTRRFCVSVSAVGRLDVEQRLDPRGRLLGVLPARAARARDAQRRSPRAAEQDGASSTRIDSRSMACILLDIDGVLHVSGEPDSGRRGRGRGAPPGGSRAPLRHEQLDAPALPPRRGAARDGLHARRRRAADDARRRRARARRQARARARHARRSSPISTGSSSSATTPRPCSSAAATRRSSRTRSSAT